MIFAQGEQPEGDDVCGVPHRDVGGATILVQAGRRGGGNGDIGTDKEFFKNDFTELISTWESLSGG